MGEKVCSRCCLTKPTAEFGKAARAKDGLQPWCAVCKREHYVQNKVAILEQQREYRDVNRESVLAGKRRSYQSNKDVLCERNRQYRADHSDMLRERAIRRYRDGGRPADKPWPDGQVAYSTAHSRVKATYGAASNYLCAGCGDQAHAWAYDHTDPNPLMHKGVGIFANKPPVPYSADPARYDPMCRSCHVKRDRYSAA